MNTRELVNYLAGLAENNNRAWFAMSKPSYDILRAEFTELVAQVIAATAKFDPAVAGQDPKKALFRINRDLRFSKDKSPYKTHFAAAIAPGGRKDPGSHYYFHVDHRGMLLVAGGCYLPPGDVLARIRTHIAKEPAKFKRLLGVRGLWSHFGAFADEGRLSRPPKGFTPDAAHIDYIKQKSFVVWTEETVKGKGGAALTKAITTGFKLSFPLIRWLREATAGGSSRP
jgi:uncharacterized protein (TIGR02453 family)